jgi:glycerol-3-phosphate dehydrogenase
VFRRRGRPAVPCKTDVTPLPFKGSVDLVDAARDEMVVTLADAVLRRTPLGALECPGDEELTRAATVVAGTLGWTAERTVKEMADVRRFYSPVVS